LHLHSREPLSEEIKISPAQRVFVDRSDLIGQSPIDVDDGIVGQRVAKCAQPARFEHAPNFIQTAGDIDMVEQIRGIDGIETIIGEGR
jgi:hypothetical protein